MHASACMHACKCIQLHACNYNCMQLHACMHAIVIIITLTKCELGCTLLMSTPSCSETTALTLSRSSVSPWPAKRAEPLAAAAAAAASAVSCPRRKRAGGDSGAAEETDTPLLKHKSGFAHMR